MTEITDSSLNILDPPIYDNSVESWQFQDYCPQSQDNLNQLGTPIEIVINASDTYIQPSKSYLVIKGQLVRGDNNNAYDANTQITLINNAIMFLFSEIRYSIGGMIMERIANPGQATSMIGCLRYNDGYSTSAGLKWCWSKDTTDNANSHEFIASQAAPDVGYTPGKNINYNHGFATRQALLMSANPRGTFSFLIPFDHLFGFAEYDKVIFGVKHVLSLTRKTSDNEAIHRAAGVTDGKVRLTNITWRVPFVKMEVTKLMELREIIQSKHSIPVTFSARTGESISVTQGVQNFDWRLSVTSGIEKPRWIIVGFQSNRNTTQEQNPAVFDHVNLSNAYVTLNGERYPTNDFVTDFQTNDHSILFDMFDNFQREYYGINIGTQVNFTSFKNLFPIIVFDVRRQSERLKSGVIDMMIRFRFAQGVPANTIAYATIISDRAYKLTSDGKNLTILSY